MKNNLWQKRMKFLSTSVMVCLLTACDVPAERQKPSTGIDVKYGAEGPVAWLDAPLNESRLLLVPYQIVFHITDPDTASLGELSINGNVVALIDNPDGETKLASLRYTWEPDRTRRIHTAGARAQLRGRVERAG